MASYKLTCQSCGVQAEASRRDARSCRSCRLLRILLYTSGRFKRARRCRACDGKFVPITTKDLALCGTCQEPPKHSITATCGICKEDRPQVERIPVCAPCVKGVETRPKVIRALQRGQRARREKYAEDWKAAKEGLRPLLNMDGSLVDLRPTIQKERDMAREKELADANAPTL